MGLFLSLEAYFQPKNGLTFLITFFLCCFLKAILLDYSLLTTEIPTMNVLDDFRQTSTHRGHLHQPSEGGPGPLRSLPIHTAPSTAAIALLCVAVALMKPFNVHFTCVGFILSGIVFVTSVGVVA